MSSLGVVIVTYNARSIIRDCLESLLSSPTNLKVVVVDNASTDDTLGVIAAWAAGTDGYRFWANLPGVTACVPKPFPHLTTIAAAQNGGFATGVNIGLRHLLADTSLDRFWILNPDTIVPPETPQNIASAPAGFSLLGGRILYAEPPYNIQIDAGTLNRWTGVTGNLNLGAAHDTDRPDMRHADFISGAHMVASRKFIEAAGLMPEDYFLYYEEVDWAQRRGDLPLRFCPNAAIYHRAGASIGSPTLTTAASAMSVYYKHRARLRFLRSHCPWARPTAYAYGLVKAAQFAAQGQWPQSGATLRAMAERPFLTNKAAQL